jgi:hypothetical protein
MELPTCFRLATQSLLFAWIDRPGFASNWTRLRMQVLHRDHYRCRRCGTPGDEITLQVSIHLRNGRAEGLALCAPCFRSDQGDVLHAHSSTALAEYGIQEHDTMAASYRDADRFCGAGATTSSR